MLVLRDLAITGGCVERCMTRSEDVLAMFCVPSALESASVVLSTIHFASALRIRPIKIGSVPTNGLFPNRSTTLKLCRLLTTLPRCSMLDKWFLCRGIFDLRSFAMMLCQLIALLDVLLGKSENTWCAALIKGANFRCAFARGNPICLRRCTRKQQTKTASIPQ